MDVSFKIILDQSIFNNYLLQLQMCGKKIFCVVALAACATACTQEKENHGTEFTRIYDTDSAEAAYYAVDIKQTSDNGYLMLAHTGKGNTVLLRTDANGHSIWYKHFDQYNTLGSSLLAFGTELFLCVVDFANTTTYLLKINDQIQNAEVVKTYQDNLLLLASAKTNDNGLLLLKYDNENDKTVLIKLNSSFELENSFDKDGRKEYEVQVNSVIEERINKYLLHQGPALPFFTGQLGLESGGYVFFNGIVKTDLSLIFTDGATGLILKRLTGNRFQKCVSSLTDLGNKNVGVTLYETNTNKVLPNIPMDSIRALSSGSDYEGILHQELVEGAVVKSKNLFINGVERMIIVASTKANQVACYAYDPLTKKLTGSMFFGNTHPYQVGNFVQTADGGLAVLCQTFVAGRYPRLALFKLSKKQLEDAIH